jgi:hypothetical protein
MKNPFELNGTDLALLRLGLYRLQPLLGACDLKMLVGGAGFEPATPWMSTKYSNQLN